MQNAYITTGQISDKNTIKLDEDFSLAIANFRVVLEPVILENSKPISRKKKRIKKFKPIQTKGKITTDQIISSERSR